LSLFVLVLGGIQLFVVALVDVFLGRYRRIETPVILRDIGMIVLYVVTVILVLGKAGVNLTSILTTSAVLTAIIGFALQETLSSIIAGLAIQVEKPFSVGEFVQFQDQIGQVLEINWRTTKILTAHRDVVVIPNNVITREPLINFSAPSSMHRRKIKIGLPFDVPPNRVKESIVTALRDVSGVRQDPTPQVLVVEYADSSILYRIYLYIDAFGDRENLEDRAMTRIWYQLQRDGIRIPFPIQDINVHTVGAEAEASRERAERVQRREALDRVPFLRPLSDVERDALASRVRTVSYGAGETIIRQGDEGDSFYTIAEGEVQVRVAHGEPGTPDQAVATLVAGQFFGEMSLMTGERRSATIVALRDTRLWVIDRSAFQSLIAGNDALVTAIGEVLAERRRSLEARREQHRAMDASRLQEDQDTLIKKIRQFFRL
jgi:small-conductance mechanosensitive channel/CRP-like cAMP-binding protein